MNWPLTTILALAWIAFGAWFASYAGSLVGV